DCLATTRIGDAFLEFDYASLASNLHDREGGIHLGQVFFVVAFVIPDHVDDAPTCMMRSSDRTAWAQSIRLTQSEPTRRLSMRQNSRQPSGPQPVEGMVAWIVIVAPESGQLGAAMLPSLRRFHRQ